MELFPSRKPAFLAGLHRAPGPIQKLEPVAAHLEDAMQWTEQELFSVSASIELDVAPEESDGEEKVLCPLIDLTPFRIDAALFEAERISYRVIIEIDASPESFKTMEMSFGKEFRYAEKYPRASKLAGLLALFESQLKLEQPISGSHWYMARSTTTYFQEYVAVLQAQQLWDRSEIGRYHALGKIKRARYVFKEIETHYCIWLGALENPEEPYTPSQSRDEYLKDLAEEETLIHALDADRFRAELKLSSHLFPDEQVLSILPHRRARSTHVPAEAREESIRWLKENEDEKNLG